MPIANPQNTQSTLLSPAPSSPITIAITFPAALPFLAEALVFALPYLLEVFGGPVILEILHCSELLKA